jgi:hypothetical protein
VGHAVHITEMRNAYKILVWKCEWRRQLGRPRHKWEGNIKIDLEEVRSCEVDLGFFGSGRLSTSIHSNELSGSIEGVEFLDYLSDCCQQGLCSL